MDEILTCPCAFSLLRLFWFKYINKLHPESEQLEKEKTCK